MSGTSAYGQTVIDSVESSGTPALSDSDIIAQANAEFTAMGAKPIGGSVANDQQNADGSVKKIQSISPPVETPSYWDSFKQRASDMADSAGNVVAAAVSHPFASAGAMAFGVALILAAAFAFRPVREAAVAVATDGAA